MSFAKAHYNGAYKEAYNILISNGDVEMMEFFYQRGFNFNSLLSPQSFPEVVISMSASKERDQGQRKRWGNGDVTTEEALKFVGVGESEKNTPA